MSAREKSRGKGVSRENDPADDFLAALVIHAAIQRGATRQELIDLGIRYRRLDFVAVVSGEEKT